MKGLFYTTMAKRRLLSLKEFKRRMLKNVILAGSLLIISIIIGVLGYKFYFNLSWVDALYNASMILTGMGPVDHAKTDASKIFASFYALYSGVAFLTSVAVLFGPIIHRFLHKFHLDLDED